jgi:Sulfotransferase family
VPELNLFVAETMRERAGTLGRRFQDSGLLRAVAQLVAGEQTVATVELARRWVEVRSACSGVSVFHELAVRAEPRRLVEKSPLTVQRADRLQRLRRVFPQARFIHLLRHPRSQGESLWKLGGLPAARRLDALDHSTDPPVVDLQRAWYAMQATSLTFLDGLPCGQWIRIRGEELLADPDVGLSRLAEWLGLPAGRAAVEAMKHPERSPFACFGPPNAPFGNDPEFLRSPALRTDRKPSPPPSLDGPLPWRRDGGTFSPEVVDLARDFGYT